MIAHLFATIQNQILNRVNENSLDRFVSIEFADLFDPLLIKKSKLSEDICTVFGRPAENFALVGIGISRTLTNELGNDLTGARDAIKEIFQDRYNSDETFLTPKLIGGFRFDNSKIATDPWTSFGDGQLILPKLLFVQSGLQSGVIISPDLEYNELLILLNKLVPHDSFQTETTFSHSDNVRSKIINETKWTENVSEISQNIRDSKYEKVVLAASIALSLENNWNFDNAFDFLWTNYPECFLFHINLGNGIFFGASPELLVRLNENELETAALAASIARGINQNEDLTLAAELLSDQKSKIEHQLVVDSIVDKLKALELDISVNSVPKIRKLKNIQHLLTPIYGKPKADTNIIDLVDRLHPTPAVCGYPENNAKEIINHYENFDRGWYGGPIGWVDANGKGEFAVALRSSLIMSGHAWLFAGNGIVGDSNPDDELEELLLKFQPLFDAVRGTNIIDPASISPFESRQVRT